MSSEMRVAVVWLATSLLFCACAAGVVAVTPTKPEPAPVCHSVVWQDPDHEPAASPIWACLPRPDNTLLCVDLTTALRWLQEAVSGSSVEL